MFKNPLRPTEVLPRLVAITVFVWIAAEARSAEPPPAEFLTPEEVVPGVPLDGSIIIDEDLWLRLVGEPGRHMRDAHDHLAKKEYAEAQQSLRSATSFLYIAHSNASESAREALRESVRELDRLAGRMIGPSVPSVDDLDPVLARAHHALARHRAIKAAAALDDKNYERAGNYLNSSLDHFRRAAARSDLKLRPDSVKLAKELEILGQRLIKEDPPLDDFASQGIRHLQQKIKELGGLITPPEAEPPLKRQEP